MKNIVTAVVEVGLVPESTLDELARWGMHVTAEPSTAFDTAQAAVDYLRDVYESSEQVTITETELDLYKFYSTPENQKQGRLLLRHDGKSRVEQLVFCVTSTGAFVIPWATTRVPEILTNGDTCLRWSDSDGAHEEQFTDCREVFFGDKPTFLVCTPAGEADVSGA